MKKRLMNKMRSLGMSLGFIAMLLTGGGCVVDNFWAGQAGLIGDTVVSGTFAAIWQAILANATNL